MMSLPKIFFYILQPHLILGLISQIIKVSSSSALFALRKLLNLLICLVGNIVFFLDKGRFITQKFQAINPTSA
jgi:hypothetical protein